jgi:hypothetical protein
MLKTKKVQHKIIKEIYLESALDAPNKGEYEYFS